MYSINEKVHPGSISARRLVTQPGNRPFSVNQKIDGQGCYQEKIEKDPQEATKQSAEASDEILRDGANL